MNFPLFRNRLFSQHISFLFIFLPYLTLFGLTLYLLPAYADDESVSEGLAISDETNLQQEVLKAVVAQLEKNEQSEYAETEVDDIETSDDVAESTAGETKENTVAETKESTNNQQTTSRNKKTAKRSKKRRRKKFTENELLTVDFIINTQRENGSIQQREKGSSGWIYLGRFVSNNWLNTTLDIKKSLPKVGRNYTVMQSLNMRAEPPIGKSTAQLVKALKVDDRVTILKVRRSGTKGHYWARVVLNRFN